MKTACFIVPFFGKLPDTFPVFLRTCAINTNFDFLIITDDTAPCSQLSNVHFQYTSFTSFVKRIQEHFDFPISLERPYKICDFRAAFGEIFSKELQSYQFWGHCDLDQYFGNISHFITDDILNHFDKILCLGHFTLYRNIPKINQLYMQTDTHRNQSYKDVFSTSRHWIFDEWPDPLYTSINRIVKQENIKTYYCHSCFSDLIPFKSTYQRYIFDHSRETWDIEQIANTIFVWENGNLFSYYKEKHYVIKEEILYVHIRQRSLQIKHYDPSKPLICFYPNQIYSCDVLSDNDIDRLLSYSRLRGVFHPDEFSRKFKLVRNYFIYGIHKIAKKIYKNEK